MVGLLGYENMAFLSELITERSSIVKSIMSDYSHVYALGLYAASQAPKAPAARNQPTIGSQVIVNSASEKLLQREQRKEAKRSYKAQNDEMDEVESATILGFTLDHLRAARNEQLNNNASKPRFSNLVNIW